MATTGAPVKLWQLSSGAERDLPGDSAAGGVAFLSDGRTLVTSDTALRFWTASGQPILSVVALSKAGASYALLAGSTPFVELMGIDLDSASDAFVCRLGASSFPFELCRERFEVHGMLAKALAGEPIVIDP